MRARTIGELIGFVMAFLSMAATSWSVLILAD